MAAEGGLLAHILPSDLPCPPSLDIECPLTLTKEVWLPCLLFLVFTWLLLLITVFWICHSPPVIRVSHAGMSPSHPGPPPVYTGLSHILFLPQAHRGAPSGILVDQQSLRASGVPCEVHPPGCLPFSRIWGCSCTTQSMTREGITLGNLIFLFIFLGFPSEIFFILALKTGQAKD